MATRRSFLGGALAGAVACVAGVFAEPRSVFAERVRYTQRRLNRNLKPHTERSMTATISHISIEDHDAFHTIAEQMRLAMLEKLKEEGAPVNVWRLGEMGGVIASRVDFRTGEAKPWEDKHHFYVRTRVSVERQPYSHVVSE